MGAGTGFFWSFLDPVSSIMPSTKQCSVFACWVDIVLRRKLTQEGAGICFALQRMLLWPQPGIQASQEMESKRVRHPSMCPQDKDGRIYQVSGQWSQNPVVGQLPEACLPLLLLGREALWLILTRFGMGMGRRSRAISQTDPQKRNPGNISNTVSAQLTFYFYN